MTIASLYIAKIHCLHRTLVSILKKIEQRLYPPPDHIDIVPRYTIENQLKLNMSLQIVSLSWETHFAKEPTHHIVGIENVFFAHFFTARAANQNSEFRPGAELRMYCDRKLGQDIQILGHATVEPRCDVSVTRAMLLC